MTENIDELSVGNLYDAGHTAMSNHQYEDSVKYFEELIRKAPTHLKGREMLALTQAMVGREEDAIENFDFLLEDDPENADFLSGKGSALFRIGKEEEGIKLIKESLRIKNNKELRGQLIKMRSTPINLIEIKGMGENYITRQGDYVIVKSTELLTEIGEKCIEHSAMVKLDDVAREAHVSDIKTLEKLLETIAGNKKVEGHIAQVDDLLLIEFEKTDTQT